MFIHLGQNTVVKKSDIVGIFDLDTSTVSVHTRNFLNKAERKNQVINVSFELPKSFVVTAKGKKNHKIYISQLNTTTLNKRSENLFREIQYKE